MEQTKVRYRVRLDDWKDILAFSKIAANIPTDVTLVSGHHRLNAKSFLGIALARMSWEDMEVECDYDCYEDFERFIR